MNESDRYREELNLVTQKLEQREAELAVINSIQQGLAAELDLQGVYDLVGDKVRDLFDSQATVIATFDHDTQKEHFKYLFEDGERHYPAPRPFDKIRQRLIKTHKVICINENISDAYMTITGVPLTSVPGTKLPKSILFVPLLLGDSIRGYVSLQNIDRENAFSESDVRLLGTLVNSMSVALENARLFNETTRLLAETEQRNAELAVINSVQEGLVREMDLQAIYTLVGNRICDVLKTQTLLIRTFDHEQNLEIWDYAIENGVRLYLEPRPFIWANSHLIKTKEPLLINSDYIETARKYGDRDSGVSKGLPPKSAIFVPMLVGDVVKGSVSLQNVERENAFTESDVRLLSTLTNSMSVALENARLFNETTRLLAETEQRAAELHTVNNISRAMVSQLEFDALIELVGEQMRETFKADIVYLALHDRETDMIHFPYYYGDKGVSRPFGNGITEKIILSREPLLINQQIEEAYERLKAEKKGKLVESFMGVPIIAGQESIGVISVQSNKQGNRFNENDQRLLTTIAANVGVAMQNAEAYQKLQAALTDLGAAQEQLIQQEKLASLGQLTAGIAHEIKNPLNFVNNFSELSLEMVQEIRDEIDALCLKSGKAAFAETANQGTGVMMDGADQVVGANSVASDEKNSGGIKNSVQEQDLIKFRNIATEILDDIQSNLRKVHEHGTRADGIVKSMLLHSRGGSGKVVPTRLNDLVKEYVNLAFHGMRAGKNPINVEICLETDEKIRDVPLIAEDFSRVLLNLCNNAFDAMREKELETRVAEPAIQYKPRLTVRTKAGKGRIILEVEDNGPGIPDEIINKVLQPFFTTKKGTEGTGLGLSITHDIIKAHGGEMSVESRPGATRFTLTLLQN